MPVNITQIYSKRAFVRHNKKNKLRDAQKHQFLYKSTCYLFFKEQIQFGLRLLLFECLVKTSKNSHLLIRFVQNKSQRFEFTSRQVKELPSQTFVRTIPKYQTCSLVFLVLLFPKYQKPCVHFLTRELNMSKMCPYQFVNKAQFSFTAFKTFVFDLLKW